MRPTFKTFLRIMDTQATAGETNTLNIDRLDYDYMVVDLALMGTETTDPPTVITLKQSDDNTTFANITNFVGGTDWTNPTAIRTLGNAAAGPTVLKLRVDCRGLKRYFQLTCNSATKMTQVVNVALFNGDSSPETASTAGVDVLASI